MEAERWKRIEILFNAALDREPSSRDEFVRLACRGDEPLRAEVASLLAESDPLDGFLEAPALEIAAKVLAGSADGGDESSTARPPSFIGRYRILHTLGEGGMGTVYEAEQDQPRRIVALKVIRPGLASGERLRRFKQESQALGRLQHPGIAQIYEANTADSGFGPQPYFAMELIRGSALDKYVAEHSLSVRQKLELMAKVCDAIDHAHQRGLIHRDLKPGNILIDESAQPKIVDFGVARIAENQTHATMHTEVGQIVGTLAYMSPEQVLGEALEVDVRSDVYSLGVILYELLAGNAPYEIDPLKFHESIQKIREEEPASLSSIHRNYRGDIETIVGKALNKEKVYRYASAAALAGDIRHYLNNEPIVARPPRAMYRLRKFAGRHRALVSGLTAVFAVLVAGIATSTWMAIRASRAQQAAISERDRAVQAEARTRIERDRATRAEQVATHQRDLAERAQQLAVLQEKRALTEKERADQQAATAKAESNFLENDVLSQAGTRSQVRAGVKPNPDITVRTALDRAAAHIEGKFESQPIVEASVRQSIGRAYREIGVYPEAQRHMERAVSLRRRWLGDSSPETLISMRDLANLDASQGKWKEADTLYNRILQIQQRILGRENAQTLQTGFELAIAYAGEEKRSEAEALYEQVLEAQTRTLGEENPDTLQTAHRLGMLYMSTDQPAKAESLLTRTLQVQKRVLGEDHPDTLLSDQGVASLYWSQGKYAQAEPLLTKALEIQRVQLGEEDRETLFGMNSLALLYEMEGKYAQSEALYNKALDSERRILGEEHRDTLATMQNLAAVYHEDSKFKEAAPLVQKTLEIRLRLLGDEHRDTLSSMNNLANIYFSQGQFMQAEPLYTRVLAIRRRTLGEDNRQTLMSMNNLSELYKMLGKYREAEELAMRALENRRRVLGAENVDTLVSMNGLGMIYCAEGRYAEAEALLRKALEIRHRVLGDEHPTTLGNEADLAELKRREGRTSEGDTLLTGVLDSRRRILGAAHPDTLDAMVSLAQVRIEEKKYSEAEPLLREALTSLEKSVPDSWTRFHAESLLGRTQMGQGRYPEAETLLVDGYDGAIRQEASIPSEDREEIHLIEEAILQLYSAWGKSEKATEWRQKMSEH